MKVTGEQLKNVVPSISQERAEALAAISNHCSERYKLDSVDAYHEFIANVAHESGGFRIKKESLMYTTPERLVEIWPSRFNLDGSGGRANAHDYTRQPDKLANLVYGGRMGNNLPGDGAKYVGGGFAQITGKDAYTAYRSFLASRLGFTGSVNDLAVLVQTEDLWAFDSAFWFFCEFKNLEQLAIEDRFKEIVKLWNGGYIGMPERMAYYERAKQFIV